ncbi:MAG: hypothetical protein Q9207_006757 [Kuettlingeria erythrocarpa]
MESDKVASFAALAVALVALLVASAQAIQQYFVSGQLIRLCDSVVYNRMPGQGHRVWQFSQFRFRIVYSIPQVRLHPDLWRSTATPAPSLPLDAARLPDLTLPKSEASLSALAGEASWVSFVRTVQHSCGKSLRYTMVGGDADRCPSDLPVVPMQLSMRDVVVMATKAGMDCTDISFQTQSISMQGDAGTITSSRHPVLGALIHFAPKQSVGCHGIQTHDGRIHPNWVARMLDLVTVAGRTYDLRDRKHFEEDEGGWIKASSDRAVIHYEEPVRAGAAASSNTLRHRRPVKPQASSIAIGAAAHGDISSGSTPSLRLPSTMGEDIHVVVRRPQDGDWLFSSSSNQLSTSDTNTHHAPENTAEPTDFRESPIREETFWERFHRTFFATRFGQRRNILPTSEPKRGIKIHSIDIYGASKTANSHQASDLEGFGTINTGTRLNGQACHQGGEQKNESRDSLPAQTYKTSAEQTGKSKTAPLHPEATRQGSDRPRLQLTNGVIHDARSGVNSPPVSTPVETLEAGRSKARSDFLAGRWQQTFQQRRKERSRGSSQRGNQGLLALRPKSTGDTTGDPPARNRLTGTYQKPFKHPNLAIENTPPDEGCEVHRTDSSLDGLETPNNDGRESSARRQFDAKRGLKPRQGDLIDDAAGHQGSVSSSSDNNTETKRQSRRSHRKKTTGNGSSPPQRGSTSSGEDLPRGRRRNSSLAATHSERHALRSAFPLQPGPAVISEQKASKTQVQGAKKVRVLLPEEAADEVSPLELPRRSGSFSPQMKPVLRRPTENFPEDPAFVRPGVASADQARPGKEIPANARWTKIDRKLVNPEALELNRERFEERVDHVIVLRVLTKDEIRRYAIITQKLRESRVLAGQEADSDHESPNTSKTSEASASPIGADSRQNLDPGLATALRDFPVSPTYEAGAEVSGRSVGQGSMTDQVPASSQTASPPEDGCRSSDDCDSTEPVSTASGDPSIRRQEQNPGSSPARRHKSTSRQRSSRDHGFLTYDEELLFLHSDSILKKLRGCTEQCKDVITTLEFCMSFQPAFGDDAREICDCTKACNSSLKRLLMTIEPLQDNKKAVEIVVADLDVLLHGLCASLNILLSEFDLFDITPLSPDLRRNKWKHTLDAFEKRYLSPMLHNLDLAHRLAQEIHANFKIGVFKSPESAILKQHLAQASGYKDLPSSPSSPTPELLLDPPSSNFQSMPSFLRSPSRFMQSPARSSPRAGRANKDKRSRYRRRGSVHTKGHTRATDAGGAHRAVTHTPEYDHDSSVDDSSSTTITLTTSDNNITGEISWFWLCQADVLPGCFATPWKFLFSEDTCIGAISVLLQSIKDYTNKPALCYVSSHADCEDWLRRGRTTYPSYAHDANGGVVVAGVYEPLKIDAFEATIAPLQLLGSYDSQVDKAYYHSTSVVIASLAELMSLDSWLSICGRTSDIINGPSRLLQSLPTLIQRIMEDFDLEFSSVDRASKNGGSRIIKTISGSLLQFLMEQHLSKTERLFTLVALLRTVKMALCVARGSDTAKLRDVLVHDVQVYMA